MTWYLELSAMDQFLVDMFLKSGLVLLAAWAIAALLCWRGSSAAAKHAVWSLGIGGALAMPLLITALPAFHVSLPWAPAAAKATLAAETVAAIAAPAELALAPAPELKLDDVSTSISASTLPAGQPAGLPHVDATYIAAALGRLSTTFRVWLLGVALGLLPTILGWLSLCRLRKSSRQVTGGPLLDLLDELLARQGMRGIVRLLLSKDRTMPMTWGIVRPVILLPEQAERWSSERLHVVLSHELAHIQRGDCLTRLVAQLCRAVYWFNPLAWLAQQQICALQEQAADDLVLAGGCDPPSYAEHLLAVSADHRSPAWAAGLALAMARAARLERRIVAILDGRQNRRPVSWRQLSLLAAVALVLPALLAALRCEAAAVPEPQAPAKAPPQQRSAADQALAELRAKIASQYVSPVDEKRMARGAIKGMVEALNDPYSDYLSPERMAEIQRHIGGALVGIGAQLDMAAGQIRIVTPLEDSPALKAGVQAGDVILQIDGQPAAGIELNEAVQRIVGREGTAIKLKLGRAGQEIEVNVVRGPIRLASVKGFQRGPDHRWNFMLEPGQKIGYVQIAQFGSSTAEELAKVAESLQGQGLKGLILDLRNCPGGLLESAVAVTRMFLSEGSIVSLHSRGGETTTLKAEAAGPLSTIPVVVLISGRTASAAEIVAGALQDNRRARIVGTRTLGKGTVQSIIQLDEGQGAIRLTTAQYQLPSGRNIDRKPGEKSWGIQPDDGCFVPLDAAQLKTLQQRQQQREIIGQASEPPAAVTSKWLETKQADPQLAAGLKTLAAKLTAGEFAQVSTQTPAEIEAFLKQEDVQRRREAVLENLKRLNRELADLDREAGAK